MNKSILKLAFLSFFALSIFNFSSAQVATQPTLIQIPQNVVNTVTALQSKYSFNQAQTTSLNQVARSYQYIFKNPPTNKSYAYSLSIRDVAATNCASSRILGSALDDSVNQIENASIDSAEKRSIYDAYTNFLDENTPNPVILDSCEDGLTSTPVTNTQNNNFVINLNGVIPDSNISSGCVILTHFMEFGSRDSQVLPLQNFLMQNGYLEMYPTGFFGRNTEFAVKEWQKRHDVDVKGWAGPSTRGTIAGVSCKSQAAFDKAFKGASIVVTKKVLAKTPIIQNKTVKTVVIATTTEEKSYVTQFVKNVSSVSNLSSTSGTFYLQRNPINTLYFTYKANANTDDIFMCFEKVSDGRCQNAENFDKLKASHEPGSIEVINNNTKWIIIISKNEDTYGVDGGKFYLRNGIGNISEVYTIKVSDSK